MSNVEPTNKDIFETTKEHQEVIDHQFDKGKVWQVMIKVAGPIILLMLFNSAYLFIDSLMSTKLTWYGEIKNTSGDMVKLNGGTSIGLIFPLMNILLAFGISISIGTGYMYTRSVAEKNRETASRILGQSFTLSVIVGLLVIIFTAAIGYPYILTVSGNWHSKNWGSLTNKMTLDGYEYMIVLTISFIPMMIQDFLIRSLRGEGKSVVPSLIPILTFPINIGLDYIFMSDKFVNAGIVGAGVATLIASSLGAGACFIYALYSRNRGEFCMKINMENLTLNKSLLKSTWNYGFGSFYRRVFNGVSIIILSAFVGNLVISSIGKHSVPIWTQAWTMMTRCTNMGSMVALGTGQGMSLLVTYYWNSNQKEKALKAIKIGFISIVTSSFIVAFLLMGLSPFLFGPHAYNIEGGFRGFDKSIGLAYLLIIIYLIPLSIQMGPLLIYSGMKSPSLSWKHTTIFNMSLIITTSIFFVVEVLTKNPIHVFIGIALGSILGFLLTALFFMKRYKSLLKTNI